MSEEEKTRRIEEIDKRINDLKEHAIMWAHAGGQGGYMAMQANGEIQDLEMQKNDLIFGTHKVEIQYLTKQINLLENDSVVQKIKHGKTLKELKSRREQLISIDNEIEYSSEKTMKL